MNYKILFLFFLPSITLAQGFVPLVGIPGLGEIGGPDGLSNYVNAVYRLAISVAALIAVVKIIGAGVKYMFSDIVTSKSDAIKDIRGSLLGLLVVIGAVLILSTVNEDLTNFQITLAPQEVTAPAVAVCEINNACTGVGYTCINIRNSNSCTRIDFETNCAGENAELKLAAGGDELRCYMLDAATEETIITNLGPGIDVALQASILQRTRDFLKTHLILDTAITTEIATENGAGEVIMAVVKPSGLDGFNNVEGTIEEICTEVATARGSETMGIASGTTPSGTEYIACVEI